MPQSNHQSSKMVSYNCCNISLPTQNISHSIQNQPKNNQLNHLVRRMTKKMNGKQNKNITRDGLAVTHHHLHGILVHGMMMASHQLNVAVEEYIPIVMDFICDMHEECIQATMTMNMKRK